ncbi:phospho-sugar mutase [Evtepia sp.]|uniref:phospho-sugar mutase n=1 Tax=Evtepia sp. TaxID=2773933 RepID=UPI002A7FC5DD|nr:phospho-sugar mutase [Evtepia sp.]MDY3992553.1 phospho-sugar mutase [Evtepia sp.]MDY4429322.1 phospho-sugar mutase [Evtepia sp.]
MSYQERYHRWLRSDALSPQEKAELEALDPKEIEDRFFGMLEFGTAGLRGVMGLGLRRMNVYVIRHATQAFAQVILAEGPQQAAKGVAICYDCRIHSAEFAREAACVMAANGIPVRLFDAMHPTPELSFAVREYGCIAGLNVTASHNPPEYNGYKVYWSDGAQLPPHHAAAIAKVMGELDVFDDIKTMDYQAALDQGLITLIGKETDDKFLAHVLDQINDKASVAKVADTFRMVYTPFHGTGYQQIPYVLGELGIKHLYCVPEQMVIDGSFPTVKSPNPENPESFALALKLAKDVDADLILGSDPDADRVAIQVKDKDGQYIQISGNQTGVLLLDYLIAAKKRAGTLPEDPVALKSIVTTNLAKKVAESYGVRSYDTFTGFKFMAEKKNQLEAAGQGHVIFSYEESIGYMIGDYVRDKDAVTASLLLVEMTAWYAAQGMTLLDALEVLYQKHGYHGEQTVNLVMPGLEGMANMKALMAGLRANPLQEIAGTKVTVRRDYQDGTQVDAATGETTQMELSGSNVLRYLLADGTDLVIRPSGTEPKIKVYVLATGPDAAACREKTAKYAAWTDELKNMVNH